MQGFTKETKTAADGSAVAIYRREGSDQLPDPKTTSFQDFALWLRTHKASNDFYIVKRKSADDIYLGFGIEKVARSGRRIFPSTTYTKWLLWRGGKVTGNANPGNDIDRGIMNLLIENLGLEALYNEDDKQGQGTCMLLRTCLSSNAVLKKMFKGQVTNRHDLIKTYMKAVWKVAPTQYSTLEQFLGHEYYNASLADLREFTTDMNAAMERLTTADRNERQVLRDLIGDAVILDKKINPKWSLKRMTEEHQENIKAILEKQLDAESDESIYRQEMDIMHQGYRFQTISSPRAALLESKTMHNCVFYNYWKPATERRYILFHVTSEADEPMSLGFDVRKGSEGPRLEYDQMRTIHNGTASYKARQAAMSFAEQYKNEILFTVSDMNRSEAKGTSDQLSDDGAFDELPY